MLLLRIWTFLGSHHLSSWLCIDIVRRNSVLVTHGNWRVKRWLKGNYPLTILFLFFHRPSIENGMFFTDLPSWGLHLPMTPWKRRLWVHSLFSNCSHNRLCFNSPNSDSLICQGLSGKKKFRFTPLPLTHRHTPLAQSVKSKVVLLHVKILEKRTGLCNPTCFLSLFTKLVGPLRVKGKINRELVWYLAVDRVFILKFFA